MDLYELIGQLRLRKERIDRAITAFENLQKTDGGSIEGVVKNRRGRKSMGLEERRQVAERMKKYWASRRKRRSS